MKSLFTQKGITEILSALFIAGAFLVSPSSVFAAAPGPATPYCSTINTATTCYATPDECPPNDKACKSPAAAAPADPNNPVGKTWVSAKAPPLGTPPAPSTWNPLAKLAGMLAEKAVDALFVVVSALMFVIFTAAGLFLTAMAKIMDFSISVTLNSDLLGNLSFVNIGWTAVRDISNMFFIFALLYIAIQTILGLSGGGAKRWLAHIIIAALLINFSLFATKVVIDAGNVLGVAFWSKMKVEQGQPGAKTEMSSASTKILAGLDLQTTFKNDPRFQSDEFNNIKKSLAYAGGAIFMFIAGYVLLAGALMMITRTVMLVILMIFSPFAFMAFGLPKLEKHGHAWFDKLISQTFSAPFFVFMLYLNGVMIDKLDIFRLSQSKGESFAAAFTGGDEFAIVFNFILMIGFLISSITVANSFAGATGQSARGWAKSASKWMGGAATGVAATGAGIGLRNTAGKVGAMTKDNEKLHELAAQKGWRGMLGRGLVATASGASRASFDVRATQLGNKVVTGGGFINAGKARGAGGFETTGSVLGKLSLGAVGTIGSAKEKEILEIADRRYKGDPAGREAYLRANLGTYAKENDKGEVVERFASRYDTDDLKKTREGIDREAFTSTKKEAIKDNVEKEKEARKKLNDPQLAEDVKAQIIKDIEGFSAEITKAMKGLTSQEITEMLPKNAASDAFVGNLTRQDLHKIHQMENEGKFTGATVKDASGNEQMLMERVAEGVLKGNNESAKTYLASPEGQEKLFNIPVEKHKDLVEAIDQAKKAKAESVKLREKLKAEREKNRR